MATAAIALVAIKPPITSMRASASGKDLSRDYVQHSLEMPKQKSRKYLIRLSMERATGIEPTSRIS